MIIRKLKILLVPSFLRKWKNKAIFKLKLGKVQRNHKKELKRVKGKNKIKVVFILIHETVWKYEGIYRFMEKDNQFEPIVIVCPYTSYGKEVMFNEMNKTFISFKNNTYNVLKSFNDVTGEWMNIKKDINPDLIFFTNPWKLTIEQYCIDNFLDKLTCYVPYGFKNSYLYQAHFNLDIHNFAWKFFLETKVHQKLSKKYSRNKSVNTVVTGYPGLDPLMDKSHSPINPWKLKDPGIKRIIWAPHHTIPGYGSTLDYSTFLTFCDVFFEVANKYRNEIQIAFKPHPVLKAKLSTPDVWGKERTDEYYKKWQEMDNGMLHDKTYIDLFLTSDAIIHDCGSFVTEYLSTTKPAMFLMRDNKIPERFNEIGNIALQNHYKGSSLRDIYNFIENIVLNNDDPKMNGRIKFKNNYLNLSNNKSASYTIFQYLKNNLNDHE